MAFDRNRLQPGEVRQCSVCGATVKGAATLSGDVLAIDPGVAGDVWVGENAAGSVICAKLTGPLLDAAREQGIGLKQFHVHPHA